MDKKQENGLSPERTEQLRALLLALESKMKHLQANEDFAALSDEVMRPVRGRLNSPDVVCFCPMQPGSGLRWAALVLIGTVSARKFCTADGVGA